MARPRLPDFTPEQREQIEELMKDNLPLRHIAKRLELCEKRLRSHYPDYRKPTSKRTSEGNSTTYVLSNSAHGALYNPSRDGAVTVQTFTAKFFGDPPPGRREMLERWAQNSTTRSRANPESRTDSNGS